MENKVKELVDTLYKEGIQKGSTDANQIVEAAKAKAASIITEGERKANEIVAAAKKEAGLLKEKTVSELKIAERDSLTSLKQEIHTKILKKTVHSQTTDLLGKADFLKTILHELFKSNFIKSDQATLIFPEKLKTEVLDFFKTEFQAEAKKGIEVAFDKRLTGGFKISSDNGAFLISLTDADIENLLTSFLRPKTKEILFS